MDSLEEKFLEDLILIVSLFDDRQVQVLNGQVPKLKGKVLKNNDIF